MSFICSHEIPLGAEGPGGQRTQPQDHPRGLGLIPDLTFPTRLCSVRARGWDLVQRVSRGIWGQANEYFLQVQGTAAEVPQDVCCPGNLEKAVRYLRTS